MKIVTIIQARMGSTRLFGKVMADLGGDTVLSRVVRRMRRATLAGSVIVATTTNPIDDVITQECDRLSVPAFRGHEEDVLDRYYHAALWAGAQIVVRISSDCPLIEPEISDETIRRFLSQTADYASNALEPTYPCGLSTEVLTQEALAQAWHSAKKLYQRVHVTPYIYEHPARFRIVSVSSDANYGSHRWTLDTPEDLAFVRAVYERMGNNDDFHWHDVLALLDREPLLMEMNRNVRQKPIDEC